MSDISKKLIEIGSQFEDNQDLLDAIIEQDNSDDLLTAIGMAIANSEGMITINETGKKHLKLSLEYLEQIIQDLEGDDN
jgi:hypothetical protein